MVDVTCKQPYYIRREVIERAQFIQFDSDHPYFTHHMGFYGYRLKIKIDNNTLLQFQL